MTKDYRHLKFIFDNFDDCNNSMLRIQYLAFLENDRGSNELSNVFAFDFYYPMSVEDAEHDLFEDGWDIYRDPLKEFERQGIDHQSPVITYHIYNYILGQEA